MPSNLQRGVLLPPGRAAEASSITLSSFDTGKDASALYAHLFDTSESSRQQVKVQELPINAYLPTEDRLLLVHASTIPSSASNSQAENRLASEVLLEQAEGSASIQGKAYLLYADAGKDLRLRQDWQALHDVCYGARLANVGKSSVNSSMNVEDLAKQFISRRGDISSSKETKMMEEDAIEDEEGGDWTDEEVEKPREPKKEVDSDDDQEMDDNQAGEEEEDDEEEEEDFDSEGSYEDESELESDDDDDPRKKALLEMIQAAIMKDGKLDLERLGLVEKNGKLVPKDD